MGSVTPEVSDLTGTGDDAARARGDAGPRRGVLVGLVVLLVAALVGLGIVWQQERTASQQADLIDAEAAATDAAADIAVAMTSYDFRTVDEDFSWVEEDGTAEFQETYAKSTEPIRELVEKTKATAEGTVTDAAATADDPAHVTVLLFVDQALRRTGEDATIDSTRVVMHMVLVDGQWLVDDVELR